MLAQRSPCFTSKVLRIDVDHRGDAGLAHRGGGVAEKRRGPGGDAARLLGLRHELGAMPAAEAKQWSRAEEVIAEARLELRQQAGRGIRVGPRCDDPDDV